MSKIQIREIKELDVIDIIQVINESIQVSYKDFSPKELLDDKCTHYTPDSLGKLISSGQYFVAEEVDGNLVGIIGLVGEHIRTFFVHPNFQGFGVGGKLYKEIEKFAYSINILILKVKATVVSEKIYTHFGFVRLDEKCRERVGIRYTSIIMEKKL